MDRKSSSISKSRKKFVPSMPAISDYCTRLQQFLVYGKHNRVEVDEAIARIYQTCRRQPPKIVWCESPYYFSNVSWLFSVIMSTQQNSYWRSQLITRFKRSSNMRRPEVKKLWTILEELLPKDEEQIRPLGTLFNSELTDMLMKNLSPKLAASTVMYLSEGGKREVEQAVNQNMSPYISRLRTACTPFVSEVAIPGIFIEADVYAPPGANWMEKSSEVSDRLNRGTFASSWTTWDLGWLAAYGCIREVVQKPIFDKEVDKQLDDWMQLLKNGLAYLFLEDYCFVCAYPTSFLWDDRGLCHSADAPGIEFSDGFKQYYWHGTRIPGSLIQYKRLLAPWMIDIQPNAEVRRVMMEIYGWDKYLRKSRAKKLHQDECGILWMKEFRRGEPLVAVDVLNSTPEPDGSYKRYLLRVPPTMHTAREAVAWTFGMDEKEYRPEVET